MAKAVELYQNEKYEEAFELTVHFDKYQRDRFFKETGYMTEEDRIKGRLLMGAYKIECEKDPKKREQMMKVYNELEKRLNELLGRCEREETA